MMGGQGLKLSSIIYIQTGTFLKLKRKIFIIMPVHQALAWVVPGKPRYKQFDILVE